MATVKQVHFLAPVQLSGTAQCTGQIVGRSKGSGHLETYEEKSVRARLCKPASSQMFTTAPHSLQPRDQDPSDASGSRRTRRDRALSQV